MHGDFRLDNALVVGEADAPHISAILDWEMATLGDPFVDLGIFALYWDIAEPARTARPVRCRAPSTPRPATPRSTSWSRCTRERAGIGIPDLRWYRAFAAYKLAVILEGIHYRYQAGDTVGDGFDRMGALVEPLARKGLEVR